MATVCGRVDVVKACERRCARIPFPVRKALFPPIHALSVPVRIRIAPGVVLLLGSSGSVRCRGRVEDSCLGDSGGSCTHGDGWVLFSRGAGLGNKRSERGMGGRVVQARQCNDPEETVGGGGGRSDCCGWCLKRWRWTTVPGDGVEGRGRVSCGW
jgi:hypothetical protein